MTVAARNTAICAARPMRFPAGRAGMRRWTKQRAAATSAATARRRARHRLGQSNRPSYCKTSNFSECQRAARPGRRSVRVVAVPSRACQADRSRKLVSIESRRSVSRRLLHSRVSADGARALMRGARATRLPAKGASRRENLFRPAKFGTLACVTGCQRRSLRIRSAERAVCCVGERPAAVVDILHGIKATQEGLLNVTSFPHFACACRRAGRAGYCER